jgi:gliding motility-associated-like protein
VVTDASGCTDTVATTITQPLAITISVNQTQVNCYGDSTGQINLNVTGGVLPYLYDWSNGTTTQNISSLPAGLYAVIIEDGNGCKDSTQITINQNPAIFATLQSNATLCSGSQNGSLSFIMSGGVGQITYSTTPPSISGIVSGGSDTIFGLSSGNYNLLLTDAFGCSGSFPFVINAPQPISIVANSVQITCNGLNNGSITISSLTGGTAPYSFAWDNGATTQSISSLSSGVYDVVITDINNCTYTQSWAINNQPSSLLATLDTVVQIICNGQNTGEILIDVTGGTPPYVYNWTTQGGGNYQANTQDISNLSPGNYSVTVTDNNGCISSLGPFNLSVPTPILYLFSTQNVLCNGGTTGSINLTPSGGISPYTYSWSNGSSNEDLSSLVAGVYNVIITDANLCFVSASATIIQPQNPLLLITTQTNVLCYGGNTGAIDLTVSGGTQPYSYQWSNSTTGQDPNSLLAGVYNVIVTDLNGCDNTISATINQPVSPLVIDTFDVNSSICFGNNSGSIDISVSGGLTSYLYQWSNGAVTQDIQNLTPGNYAVTVTDANGCTVSQNGTIIQPAPSLQLTASQINVTCFNGSNGSIDLTVIGGAAPYIYSWSNGDSTEDLNNLTAGQYIVLVTAANGCTAQTSLSITQPNATLQAFASVLSNNPCFGNSVGQAAVGAVGGTQPYTYLWSNLASIDTASTLAAGLYSVTVTDANGCTDTTSVTISQPISPLLLSTSHINVACFGASTGSINLTPTGGTAPYTYAWSNNTTSEDPQNLAAGTYTVTVTDANGCTGFTSAVITQPANPLSASHVDTNVTCNGLSNGSINVTVTGGVQPYTYAWSHGPITEDLSGLSAGTYNLTITYSQQCTSTLSITITQPQALSLSTTQTNVICNSGGNGSIDLTVTGGTAPYTYSWNNNSVSQDVNNLSAGTYNVTVTDANGCQGTTSATVTAPAALLLNLVPNNVLCYGASTGSIDLTPTGGTSPYNYQWSNNTSLQDPQNLASGTYSVVVTDANGCSETGNTAINQPASGITITPVVTPVTCNGLATGAIDISVVGGSGVYTYLWSNGAVSEDIGMLLSGNYIVDVTYSGQCSASATINVPQPSTVVLTTTQVNLICNGVGSGSINLTASGGTGPYTYLWSNGAQTEDVSNLSATNYSVTVTDVNGCAATTNATIIQPSAIQIAAGVTNVLCFGAATGIIDLTVSGGSSPYTYLWNNSESTEDIDTLSSGTYSVIVTDANGCTANASATINQPPAALLLSTSQVNVACHGASTGSINLTPTGGTAPYTYAWSNNTTTQDPQNLAAGTYTVTVTDANGCANFTSVIITQPLSGVSASYTQTNVSCNGLSDGAINVSVTGGTVPYTYAWSHGPSTEDLTGLSAGTYNLTITYSQQCTSTLSVTITQPQVLSLGTTQTNVSCNSGVNGSIDLTVTGGTAPYTYSWTNSSVSQDINNLGAGTYTVTVTDANGCQGTTSATVIAPSALSLNAVPNNVLCYGASTGSIDLTPTGGTAPYTYLWSNGSAIQDPQNLVAGAYSVVVTDANGCTGTTNTTITEPASGISITSVVTPVTCNGLATGSINLTVSGGTGSYTYLWNNGAVSEDIGMLLSGNYIVDVTYSGQCSASATINVPQPSPVVLTTTQVNLICNGISTGSIDLIPTGGSAPYSYSWNNGANTQDVTNLAAGTYTVTVTDANSCQSTTSATLIEPTAIQISPAITDVLCNGNATGAINITVTGGTGAYTYLWNTSATTEDINTLASGTYSVVVMDANGCTANASATINQPPAALLLSTSQVNVSCHGANTGSIDLTPTGGTAPYTYAWSNNTTSQDPQNLAAGTYTVTVTDANGCANFTSVIITQPLSGVSASYSQTNVSCNGLSDGAINISVTGGTVPYTYAWSHGPTTEDLTLLSAGSYNVTITDSNQCQTSLSVIITQPQALSVSTTQTNVSCNSGGNGSVDLTVAGGTSPYMYLWNNNSVSQDINNLSAGTYNVTVTDANGCQGTTSATISGPVPIALSTTQVNVLCFGNSTGSIDLSPTGGTTPYTYLWSNGSTVQDPQNLAAGVYSVVVTDANGCTATTNATITQPQNPITLTTTKVNVLCFGNATGSIDLTVSGGTGIYTYSWNTGAITQDITGLIAGIYTVTVTDANACTATTTVTITQPQAPLALTTSQVNVLCFGNSTGSINLTPTGGTPLYTYVWSNGPTTQDITGLVAGSYEVIVTDVNGCKDSITSTIIQPQAPLSLSTTQVNVLCFGNSTGSINLTPTGGTTPYTYLWSNGSTVQDPQNLAAGVYSVVVTDANGCTATTNATITQPQNPITLTTTKVNVLCFGNATGSIDLTVSGGTGIYTYAWNTGAITQDLTGLIAGTYTVTVTDANACTATTTVIITQPLAPLALTTSQVNVLCFGNSTGSINLTPTGGTPLYTYVWSNGPLTQDINNLPAGTYNVTVTDANSCTATVSATITQPTAPLSLSATQVNVLCFGNSTGSINLTPIGGTTPYTYLWSNGSTVQDPQNLAAGTYSVVVTDANGCTATTNATITQPQNPITLTTTKVNVLCFGNATGSIDLTVSGGTGIYTYSWNTGAITQDITGLIAGTYTVTVTDANACTATTTVIITQPLAPLALTTSQVNVLCFGNSTGSINLTPTGGTPLYTYVWSNGPTTQDITGLVAGSYEVIITDVNGCKDSITATITQPQVPLSLSTTQVNVLCFGNSTGSINLTPTGGTAPYTYLWSNGSVVQDPQNLVAGAYSVVVTDANGCTETTSATITQPAMNTTLATSHVNVLCFGDATGSIDLTVTGVLPPYTFNWSNTATTEDIIGLIAGLYTVTVTDANGCTATTSATISQPTTPLSLSTSQNNVCFGVNNGDINLTVSGGSGPYTYLWSNGQTTQDINGLAPGLYSVVVTDANGCVSSTSVTITAPNAPLSLAETHVDILCNGTNTGSIDLSVVGGTQPYTYLWSNGYTQEDPINLFAGTYNVTVIDANGCNINLNITLTQPVAPFTLAAQATDVLCFGASTGAIDLIPSGGTFPYTYLWSNGQTTEDITTLFAGTYSVSATDTNGCTAFFTVQVSEPNQPIAIANTISNVLCFGDSTGAIDLTISGGTPGYAFNWNGGTYATEDISLLPSGTFIVTVTDANNCQLNDTFFVAQPITPLVSTVTSIDASCFGSSTGSIDLTVNGGTAPYGYTWSTGILTQDLDSIPIGWYYVTVTDAHGCSIQDSALILQPPSSISLSVLTTHILCNGYNTGYVDLTATGGVLPYQYNWSNGALTYTTEDLNAVPAGNYSLTLTDANGCIDNISTFIIQPDAIVATPTIVDVLCHGATTGSIDVSIVGGTPYLVGAPYSYLWNTGATTEDLTNIGAGTYVLTVTDSNNCSQTDTFTVSEPAALSVAMNAVNVVCHGNGNGSISPVVSGGVGPYTYLWTATNGGVLTTGATSSTQINLVPGTYTLLITDANGCTLIDSAVITQPQLLTMSEVHTNINCFGDTTGLIDVTVNGGTAPYTYSWITTINGLPGPTYTSQDLTLVPAGTYDLTITDANNCTVSQVVILTQPGSPISTILTSVDVLCHGNSTGGLSVNITGGTQFTPAPHYIIEYFSGGNLIASGVTSVSGLPAGVYQVKVTDTLGCYQIVQDTIFEPLAPLDYSLIPTNILCYGTTTGSIFVNITGGTAPYAYSWNNGQYVTEDITNLSVGTYQLQVTDANGCLLTTFSSTLTSPDSIQLNPYVDNVTCYGFANGQIITNASGGTAPYTYQWSTINGTLQAGQVNLPSIGSTTQPNGLTAAMYTLLLTDGNGCIRTFDVPVNQPSAPLNVVVDSLVSVACKGACSGQIFFTPTGGTPFYWVKLYDTSTGIFVDSLPISTFDLLNPNAVFSFNNLCPGNYYLFIEDSNSCSMNTVIPVQINEPATVMNSVMFVASNAGCTNASGQIQVSASGGNAPYNVSWQHLGTGTVTNPALFEILSDPGTYVATGLSAGLYNVYVTDGNGCSHVEQLLVDSTTSLLAGFLAIDTVGCAPFGVQFSNLSYGVNVSYLWDFGNGQTSTEFEPLTYFAAGGPYDISLTITDAQGCSQTYSNDNYILSYSGPNASFYAQTDNIDFYSGAIQFVNSSSNATSFVWDFGDGSPVSYSEDPAHLFESMTAGNYIVTLQAIDSNGCVDDTSMVFGSIEPLQMFVPNTISVDGNGLNDEFKPILTLPDLVTKYNLQIYNRWGQLIYETKNQYDSWNGTFRGDKVQIGTYTWKIQFNDYKGNPVNAHGHLNVIR